MKNATELHRRVLARAKADKLPCDHPMVVAAQRFTEAAQGFFSEPQTVPIADFMAAYARARRLWCEYTGEPLA